MLSKSMSLPLKVGIIGAGVIARGHHVAAFRKRPDRIVLAAVCDPARDLALALAAEAGGNAAIFADHREMLSAASIDAVIIATPHHLHAQLAEDCVLAGKPVLVEKPLVCNLAEMRRLRQLSAERRVPVVAGQMRRFEPEARWLRNWIASAPENFGNLVSFDIQAWQNLEGYVFPSGAGHRHWLLDGARAGGGVTISLAIHQLDLIRFLFNADFAAVTAHGRFDPPFHGGAESTAVVLLSMTNGAHGVLHANYLAPRVPYCEALTAFGANGTIIQHAEKLGDYRGHFSFSSSGGQRTTAWNQQFEGFLPVPSGAFDGMDPDSFVNQLVAFAEAITSGRTPANSIDENFNTIACIEAIHQSMRGGETTHVQVV